MLSKAIAQLLEGEDPEAIHDLRVSTRRLQALLSALSAFPEAKRCSSSDARYEACDRARRLAELRRLARRDRRPARASAELPAERDAWLRIEQDLHERREADDPTRPVAHPARDREEPGRPDRGAIDERLAMLARPRFARRSTTGSANAWAEWNECLQAAGQTPSVELMHAFRVATKRMRYSASSPGISLGHGRSRSSPGLAPRKKALGDWHDQEMLHRAIAEAVARPDLALEEPDATSRCWRSSRTSAGTFRRLDRSLVALARPDEAQAAMRRWRRAAVALHEGRRRYGTRSLITVFSRERHRRAATQQQRNGSLSPGEGGDP